MGGGKEVMGSPRLSRVVALGVICLAVLLTRLPFLGAGYGVHADNWRVALAARHIAETGVYEASRFPGYPVQEFVCSIFWKTGAWGLNLLDTLACTGAVLCFALICLEYGVEDWWLAGLALAFVPVLYVNSVSTKDFPWALALLLAAWWCGMRKKAVLTGVCLGVAMGVRITSGAAALPLALILIDGAENRVAMRRVVVTGVTAAVIAMGAFLPVYWRYGADFFNFYAEHAFPGRLQIAGRMTVEVWGVLGVAGVCIGLLAGMRKGVRPGVSSRHVVAWVSMVVIYGIAFLCLPDEAAYLIPAVPFVLLLVWWVTPGWGFRVCCGLVILSPFVSWSGVRPTAGAIIQDHRERMGTEEQIKGFLHFSSMVSGSNAYIVGSWEPPIDVMTADAPRRDARYLYLVTQGELDELIAKGWRVWYLPMMREFEYRVYEYDVRAHGARDVRELHPDRGAGVN
jgi:hypothetical protein